MVYRHEYWQRRADAARAAGGGTAQDVGTADSDELGAVVVPEADVRRAFEDIRARARLDARPGATLRMLRAPAIEGQRIVLQDQMASDAHPQGMRFARGVDLRRLVEEAPRHDHVPELWSAYNRAAGPVTLPDFLTALSIAFAARLLEHQER